MHRAAINDVDLGLAAAVTGREDGMLPGDDRAVDVGVVLSRHELCLGSIPGCSADGKGRVHREVELSLLKGIVALDVLEDDTKD
jgi:hypothetical protein